MPSRPSLLPIFATLALATGSACAVTPPLAPDIPKKFVVPQADADYVRREEMIPMRDGVKLYTVILVPKGAQHLPIVLTRTPYTAAKRAERSVSPRMPSGAGHFGHSSEPSRSLTSSSACGPPALQTCAGSPPR